MAEFHPPRTIANVSPLPEDQEFRQLWTQLENKLLAIAGTKVVWRGSEPQLTELVSRGQLFDQSVQMRRGHRNGCHRNAARLWARDIKKTVIVTGYGLSDDGLWRQHSWAVKGPHLIETTMKRVRYFGVVLDKFEALKFCFENYLTVEYPNATLPPQAMAKCPGLLSVIQEFVESKGYTVMKKTPCPDCAVAVGEFHKPGCDVEPCPYCGHQLLSCEHFCMGANDPPLDDRMVWTGLWPGVLECREFGWFAKAVPGKGWISCSKDDPDAHEDLNRLHEEARWDRSKKRWVKKETPIAAPHGS